MSFAAKTDYSGIAALHSQLKVVDNDYGASNGNLEIPGVDGSVIGTEQYGHIKNPRVSFKITGSVTISDLVLGKVHYTTAPVTGEGPWALRSIRVHTGAGEEPTFEAELVQIEAGATKAVCTYTIDQLVLSAARHALTFGAITYTNSATLALQSADFVAECNLDPTTINGAPVASDVTGGKETVSYTFWTNSDQTAPSVTPAANWTLTSDWTCTGADSSMFVWTATYTKYLSVDAE